jgi:hypothetical protein
MLLGCEVCYITELLLGYVAIFGWLIGYLWQLIRKIL